MSSRQEEKERRRQERLEREQAAGAGAKRKRMLQIAGGAILLLAIIGGVVYAATSGGGKSDAPSGDELKAEATKAGCVYKTFPDVDSTHLTSDTANFDDYKSNPPTQGQHRPTPAQDGAYAAGNEPDPENWVHTLEHGRIILMYKKGASKGAIAGVTELYNEPVGDSPKAYHSVLMQNNPEMPYEVAAVGWNQFMACTTYAPKNLVALRAFREARVDKAPEFFP